MTAAIDTASITPPASEGHVEPKPWVHDPSRPYFLPPGSSSPAAISLLGDSLEVVREYREFVDTVGKLEAEYGRALASAVRKLETKLDSILLPPPGGRKPPVPTLVKAMQAHLVETNTVASLHIKRPGALNDQLIRPLQHLEKKIGETSRKLGSWNKDIRTRWDAGRERVETARAKYHAAVRDSDAAQIRFRALPPPNGTAKSDSEWVKLERAAADAEATCADRKRAYIVALAGEGLEGGGGRDLTEGGGDWGWGEESRALYGHIEFTLLELLKHQAHEDKSHNELLHHIFERAEKSYDIVSIAADQNAFLEWNITNRQAVSRTQSVSSNGHESPTLPDSNGTVLTSPDRPALSTLTPISPISVAPSHIDRQPSPLTISPCGDHPSLSCLTFVAPPSARDDTPTLVTDKRADRNWLVNRWLQSRAVLIAVEGEDGNGGSLAKRRQDLKALRARCVQYAENRGLGDAEDVWEKRVVLERSMGEDERRAAVAKAEKACLEAVLGPNPAPDLAHDFKDKQFATPSPCDSCGQNVWAPLKSELTCRLCGIAVHSKCLLHVDPECTGLKSSRRKSSHSGIRRSITTRLRRTSMFESPHGAPQEYRPNPTTIEPLREEELFVSPFVTSVSTSPVDDRPLPITPTSPVKRSPTQPAESPLYPPTSPMHPTASPVHASPVQASPVHPTASPVRPTSMASMASPVRQNTATASPVRPTSIAAPPSAANSPPVIARVLEAYAAQDDIQLNIATGEIVRLLEPDVMGRGWAKVRRGLETGEEGLVPQTFLEVVGPNSPVCMDGGVGRFVLGTFDFPPPNHTPGPGQARIFKHQLYELSDEGFAYDPEWVELVVPDGSGLRLRGIVPKSYVTAV